MDHKSAGGWISIRAPLKSGISVPAGEAAEYREFQGYDNQASGRDLTGLAADPAE